MRRSWFYYATIAASVILTVFLVLVLSLIVLRPSADALLASLASSEMQFAVGLSLATASVSTLLCMLIGIPAAYALARYSFPGNRIINAGLDLPLALPPLVAGLGLLLLFGTRVLETGWQMLALSSCSRRSGSSSPSSS